MKFAFRHSLIIVFLFTISTNSFSQLTGLINPDLLNKTWQAKWIACPNVSGTEFGVYLFRKTFMVNGEIKQFIVHVSADNRYKLYVNGKYVCNGPLRGDFMKWRFESLDIASYLKSGENIITAIVWNFGELRPVAQFSNQTGFILQGDNVTESIINTDKSWHVLKDSSYSPLPVNVNQYYIAGPGEKFNGNYHPWNWMQTRFADVDWQRAKELEPGAPLMSMKEWGSPAKYILTPREIPLMEETPQRFARIRRSNLIDIPDQFLSGEKSLAIPAYSKIKILFDQDILTNAYPVLNFSKGLASQIKLTYAESLFNDKIEKGNRNEVENKNIIGNQDIIISDGGNAQAFQTLWWRTFRYVEMEIDTKEEPLTITDFYSIFTGYPLKENATFKCDDPLLTNIWNVGWHTQRLCTGETFFDCPYYEQLQYVGDARIQCLTTTSVSGDSTLMRNAVSFINDSRLPIGLTQSRYPSYQVHIIPPFSLIWITMVYDYWMQCQDPKLIQSMIPGILDVLHWYELRIDSTGMLGRMEWWNFVDWAFEHGVPPGINNSNSSIISLQLAYTLQKASILLNAYNFKEQSFYYSKLADEIKSAVYNKCYDKQRALMADSPEKTSFSQHANIMAVLTDAISKELQKDLLKKIIAEKDIVQCSYYYSFYLTEALEKAGLSDLYPDMLGNWKLMLDIGLTTFAETSEPTRSDCHAWSASPVYYFLSLICGIKPNEPGFKSVKIEPNLGRLNWIEGSFPHRLGEIKINLKKNNINHLIGEVILPERLSGTFIWQGHQISLKGGINKILL
jgi:hypothetical protein